MTNIKSAKIGKSYWYWKIPHGKLPRRISSWTCDSFPQQFRVDNKTKDGMIVYMNLSSDVILKTTPEYLFSTYKKCVKDMINDEKEMIYQNLESINSNKERIKDLRKLLDKVNRK